MDAHKTRKVLICRGLQEELTPMLAGLLELGPKYAWTFDKFFSAMQQISTSTTVHVYNVAQMTLHYFYLSTGGRSVLQIKWLFCKNVYAEINIFHSYAYNYM